MQIARGVDNYEEDSSIFSLFIKHSGMINTSVQNFAVRICAKEFVNKLNILATSLLLSQSIVHGVLSCLC